MTPGIFAKTFDAPSPLKCLQSTAEAGFSCVQFNMQCAGLPSLPGAIPQRVLDDVSSACRSTGISLVALSGTYNMIHPDEAVRAGGRNSLRVLARACAALGSRMVTLCTGSRDAEDQWRHHPDNQSPAAWSDLLREFELAAEIAEEHDVLLGVEPELANVVNSAEAARRLIREVGSDRVRIVFDPANLFEVASTDERRAIVSRALDLLADRVEIAHAKDRSADGGFTFAGNGVLDYPHFISILAASGFNGPVIAHGLSAGEAPVVAAFLARTIGGANA